MYHCLKSGRFSRAICNHRLVFSWEIRLKTASFRWLVLLFLHRNLKEMFLNQAFFQVVVECFGWHNVDFVVSHVNGVLVVLLGNDHFLESPRLSRLDLLMNSSHRCDLYGVADAQVNFARNSHVLSYRFSLYERAQQNRHGYTSGGTVYAIRLGKIEMRKIVLRYVHAILLQDDA